MLFQDDGRALSVIGNLAVVALWSHATKEYWKSARAVPPKITTLQAQLQTLREWEASRGECATASGKPLLERADGRVEHACAEAGRYCQLVRRNELTIPAWRVLQVAPDQPCIMVEGIAED